MGNGSLKPARQQVLEILMEASFREAPPEEEASLKEDLGIDSLRLVELMIQIEEALDITFEESDLDPDELATVGDLERVVETYAG